MALVDTAQKYLTLVTEYRHAPEWQKKLLLRGDLLAACQTLQPERLRHRLRAFCVSEASKMGFDIEKWKSWA